MKHGSINMMGEKNLLFDLANELVKKMYKVTLDFPFKYQSSIGDQSRRASLSIVLNIVEGGARKSPKERKQFLNIAYSSLKEAKYLIYFSYECGILKETEYLDILKNTNRLAAILYGLLYKK